MYIYTSIYVSRDKWACRGLYAHVYVYIYTNIYIYMCVCVYIYTRVHLYTFRAIKGHAEAMT